MIYDYTVMNKVGEDLKDKIIGGNIAKIQQSSPLNIILIVKKETKTFNLLISIEPQNPRIYITNQKAEEISSNNNFSLLLKKYISNGKIIKITVPPQERIMKIDIKGRDEIGRPVETAILAEIMGRHSNIILTSANREILGCAKHITSRVNRYREIIPGEIYIPPPVGDKKDPLSINQEIFLTLLKENKNKSMEECLIANFKGMSLLLAKEIILRSGNPSPDELDNLYSTLLNVLKEISIEKKSILYNPLPDKKPPWELPLAYPVKLSLLKDFPKKEFTDINMALDYGYRIKEKDEKTREKKQGLLSQVKSYKKRLFQLKEQQEKLLKKAEKAEEYRKKGEILLANINIEGENKILCLKDIFESEEKEIEIEINSEISISQNAQNYFKKYKKAVKTKKTSSKQLDELVKELEYIENILVSIDLNDNIRELEEIKEELIENGIIKEKIKQKKKDKKSDIPSFIKITSPDGWDILIGKNNRQNDFLTMKVAKGNDIWLHAKGIPGSHVIIKNSKGGDLSQLPYKTLLKAAELAAYHSKSRNSTQVLVDYTQRKYVKKPKEAKPGMVIYHGEKSISVEPKKG